MRFSADRLHRCFYALALPSQAHRAVSALISDLRSRDDGAVRWTPPQNLHLTLRFLGELEEGRFGEAQKLLHDMPSGEPFRLKIEGVDGFPSLRKPSVLILAAKGNTEENHQKLLALQRRTEEFARQLRLEPEPRPFRPHITLGRVRRDRSLSPLLRNGLTAVQQGNPDGTEGEISSLLLMESIMKPTGVEYRLVAEKSFER